MLDHARNTITWDDLVEPMTMTSSSLPKINTSFSCTLRAAEIYANANTTILHAKYDQSSPEEVVDEYTHLNIQHKLRLLELLSQFFRIFTSTLGRYVHKNSIQLKYPHTLPIICTYYSIPLVHQKVFQKELLHLIDRQVLRRIPRS